MHPHARLITEFYDAFQALDARRMTACYHPEATFSDPVFPGLHGKDIGTMWRMLTNNARDLRLRYGAIDADDDRGSAQWEADYTFGKARRPVHNAIQAEFGFRDGLIVHHVDSFDLWRWSRMALGAPGVMLGWSPFLQRKIQKDAAARLARFGQTRG